MQRVQEVVVSVAGVGLADSPAGLASYIIEKFSTGTNYANKFKADGGLLEKFTYDELIDNLMMYWVSNSITTAVRIYAEFFNKHDLDIQAMNWYVFVCVIMRVTTYNQAQSKTDVSFTGGQ